MGAMAQARGRCGFYDEEWKIADNLLAEIEGKYNVDFAGNIIISEVIYFDSTMTKEKLFNLSREFYSLAFNGHFHDVAQIEDKEAGLLLYKGNLGNVYCDLFWSEINRRLPLMLVKIEIKDYKVRVSFIIYNFEIFIDTTQYTAATTITHKPTEYYPINTARERYGINGKAYNSDRAEKSKIVEGITIAKSIKNAIDGIANFKHYLNNYNTSEW
jgi:hypothetical protein